MAPTFFKRFLPDPKKLREDYPIIDKMSYYFNTHNSLKFEANPVAVGVAAGLFSAFIPLPIQTVLSILIALCLRGNIIIAVAFTWVSNPITFVPIVYLIYRVGGLILGVNNAKNYTLPDYSIKFSSFSDFWISVTHGLSQFSLAFIVGLPLVAFTIAALGYLVVISIWYGCSTISRLFKKK